MPPPAAGTTIAPMRPRDQNTPRQPEDAAPHAPRACRTCGADLPPDEGPFCSERCRLADLNKWFRGDYRISRDLKPEDFDELE